MDIRGRLKGEKFSRIEREELSNTEKDNSFGNFHVCKLEISKIESLEIKRFENPKLEEFKSAETGHENEKNLEIVRRSES